MLLTVVTVVATERNKVEISAGGKNVKVTFFSPTIVRVQKSPEGKSMPETESEVVTMTPKTDFETRVKEGGTAITMTSTELTVTLDKRSGLLQFSSKGKNLLKENLFQRLWNHCLQKVCILCYQKSG